MNTVITRPVLLAALRQIVETLPAVQAAWEGGSAAFSYRDQWSDIDAVLVVDDEAVAAVFAAIEAGLAQLSPIDLAYEVPATQGYQQRFYRLQGCSEFLVVDLVLLKRSDPLLFREVELHGHGQTWLDRAGLLAERHLDPVLDLAQAHARLPALRASFAMFQHIPTKERLRGRAVEALQFYQRMTLQPLVEALRLLHCPQRRGFGLRYLARDLPPEVCARIEALAFVRDLADLEIKHGQAQQWFWQCMEKLESQAGA